MTCHFVVDEKCNRDDLGVNVEAMKPYVTWTCPDGTGSGATCTKGSNNENIFVAPFRGWSQNFVGGVKNTKKCECKNKCKWKGTVADLVEVRKTIF